MFKRSFLAVPLGLLMLLATAWLAWTVYHDTGHVTDVLQGEPANPLTFMTAAELERTEQYARTKDALYVIATGFDWFLLLFLLAGGLSSRFRNAAERLFKRSTFGQVLIYALLFQGVTTLFELPLAWYRHVVDLNYGLSNMTAGAWFQELLTDFLVGTALLVPVLWIAVRIIRKSPTRWWLWFWLATIPMIVFLSLVQPIVLDPLYNDFRSLQNVELKAKILDMAHEAGVPTDDVYEVDMSTKTNALNAYVNGIGPSARIVLWDTTLAKLEDDEILFIMAHEIGHYVKNHVLWGMVGSLVLALATFWLLSKCLRGVVRSMGEHWGLRSASDLAALPAVFLLLSVLGFASSPLENYVSRIHEQSADQYAVELTGNPQAGIMSFQKLSRLSLSDPNPPELIKWLRYSHPTISERIRFLEAYRNESLQK